MLLTQGIKEQTQILEDDTRAALFSLGKYVADKRRDNEQTGIPQIDCFKPITNKLDVSDAFIKDTVYIFTSNMLCFMYFTINLYHYC